MTDKQFKNIQNAIKDFFDVLKEENKMRKTDNN